MINMSREDIFHKISPFIKAVNDGFKSLGNSIIEIHEVINELKAKKSSDESSLSDTAIKAVERKLDTLRIAIESDIVIYTPITEACRFVLVMDNLTSGDNPQPVDQIYIILKEKFGMETAFAYLKAMKRPLEHEIVRPNLLSIVKLLLDKFAKEYKKSEKKEDEEEDDID